MRAEVHRELAGVAAGVGADLALERPLVEVDAQVLLQAAAVCGCVGAVLALVRLLARVGAAVHVELVPPAEALVAQLALKRLFTWITTTQRQEINLRQCQTFETCGIPSRARQPHVPVCVLRCRSMSFWPYCVLKVQPAKSQNVRWSDVGSVFFFD